MALKSIHFQLNFSLVAILGEKLGKFLQGPFIIVINGSYVIYFEK